MVKVAAKKSGTPAKASPKKATAKSGKSPAASGKTAPKASAKKGTKPEAAAPQTDANMPAVMPPMDFKTDVADTVEHKWLAKWAGVYKAKYQMYFTPDMKDPARMDGERTFTSTLKGMLLEGKAIMKDDKGKITMEGRDTYGYDHRNGEFYLTWNDATFDFTIQARGKKEGNKIILHGSGPEPLTGGNTTPVRLVIDWKTFAFELYRPRDDKDKKVSWLCMRVEYEKLDAPAHAIHSFSLLVKDFDEARDWYVQKLGFTVQADAVCGPDPKEDRWVTVQAPGSDVLVSLWKAKTAEQKARVGKQGGDLGFYITTLDCHRDYKLLKSRGVKFTQEPKDLFYGIDAHLQDLYGNGIGLCQSKPH